MDKPFNPDHEILDYFDSLFTEEPAKRTDSGRELADPLASNDMAIPLAVDAVPPNHTELASTGVADTALGDTQSRGAVAALRRQPLSQAQPQEPIVAIAELEAVKRERLQALLSQQLPKVIAKRSTLNSTENLAPVSAPFLDAQQTPVLVPAERAIGSPDVVNASVEHHNLDSDEHRTEEDETSVKSGVNAILAWQPNGRPVWAQQRFEVLLFDVSGLTLAVPLVALGQIQQINQSLAPVFGQSDWFMGLLKTAHGHIKTLNTALFVMPEKYDKAFLDTAKYVVTIDGLPWGLAVNSVNQPVTLEPSDVVWRSKRTKRPWLAGTVKSAMCALVDIPQMAAILTASEKKAR